jgi:hypothetical protein
LAPARSSWRTGQDPETESGVGRSLIQKTWVWFRHATTAHRQQPD